MKKVQMEGTATGPVCHFVLGSEPKPSWNMVCHLKSRNKPFLTSWNKLSLKEGMLCYHWVGKGFADEDRLNLVLQDKY